LALVLLLHVKALLLPQHVLPLLPQHVLLQRDLPSPVHLPLRLHDRRRPFKALLLLLLGVLRRRLNRSKAFCSLSLLFGHVC
jgi:hypothetical protein